MSREAMQMALEAGFTEGDISLFPDLIAHFATIIAKHEREACAEACEEVESRAEELWDKFAYPEDQGMASGARQCAAAIRARREK